MNSKKQKCYEAIFRYIEEKVTNLNPKSFHTDYEAGLRAALRAVYSNVQLKGCWLVLLVYYVWTFSDFDILKRLRFVNASLYEIVVNSFSNLSSYLDN